MQVPLQLICEGMTAVMGDAALALTSGFDDPDVMAAVVEIAACPAALQKHGASNAKVNVL